MKRFGDDSTGFSVDHPETGRVLVRGWGFWSVALASAFAPAVIEACQGQARGTILTLDMGDLKPMREEGQQSFSRLLLSLPSLGMTQISVVTTNPLTKLQLLRLVTESRTGIQVEWDSGAKGTGRSA
jgi:hypothetical protein